MVLFLFIKYNYELILTRNECIKFPCVYLFMYVFICPYCLVPNFHSDFRGIELLEIVQVTNDIFVNRAKW